MCLRWYYGRRIKRISDELNRPRFAETELGDIMLGVRTYMGEDESDVFRSLAQIENAFSSTNPHALMSRLVGSLPSDGYHKIKSKEIESLSNESSEMGELTLKIQAIVMAKDRVESQRDLHELRQRLSDFRDHLATISGKITSRKEAREKKRRELIAHLNEAGSLSFRLALLAVLIAGASLVVALIILHRTPRLTATNKTEATTAVLHPSIAVIRQIDSEVPFIQTP